MGAVQFRKLDKEVVRGRIPAPLEAWLRRTAAKRRTSISALLTECVAMAKGDRPEVYGVVPRRPARSA